MSKLPKHNILKKPVQRNAGSGRAVRPSGEDNRFEKPKYKQLELFPTENVDSIESTVKRLQGHREPQRAKLVHVRNEVDAQNELCEAGSKWPLNRKKRTNCLDILVRIDTKGVQNSIF